MISKYIWLIAYYKYRYPPHFVFCTRAKKKTQVWACNYHKSNIGGKLNLELNFHKRPECEKLTKHLNT
jgi:hypothetical protein